MNDITLSSLRASLTRTDNTPDHPFGDIYKKLILHQSLSADETDYLFRMMNVFSSYGDEDLHKMAYSMALNYGLTHNDFAVLESYAQKLRYYPVQMLIRAYLNNGDSIDGEDTEIDDVLAASLAEVYKQDYNRSEQQY